MPEKRKLFNGNYCTKSNRDISILLKQKLEYKNKFVELDKHENKIIKLTKEIEDSEQIIADLEKEIDKNDYVPLLEDIVEMNKSLKINQKTEKDLYAEKCLQYLYENKDFFIENKGYYPYILKYCMFLPKECVSFTEDVLKNFMDSNIITLAQFVHLYKLFIEFRKYNIAPFSNDIYLHPYLNYYQDNYDVSLDSDQNLILFSNILPFENKQKAYIFNWTLNEIISYKGGIHNENPFNIYVKLLNSFTIKEI